MSPSHNSVSLIHKAEPVSGSRQAGTKPSSEHPEKKILKKLTDSTNVWNRIVWKFSENWSKVVLGKGHQIYGLNMKFHKILYRCDDLYQTYTWAVHVLGQHLIIVCNVRQNAACMPTNQSSYFEKHISERINCQSWHGTSLRSQAFHAAAIIIQHNKRRQQKGKRVSSCCCILGGEGKAWDPRLTYAWHYNSTCPTAWDGGANVCDRIYLPHAITDSSIPSGQSLFPSQASVLFIHNVVFGHWIIPTSHSVDKVHWTKWWALYMHVKL